MRATGHERRRGTWTGALAFALLAGCQHAARTPPDPAPPAAAAETTVPWESLPLPSHTGRPAGPPMQLVATDGSPLELRSVTVRAVVEHLLASTELELVIANPHPRHVEATMTIALPRHAAVGRLAADVAGRLVEAEWMGRLDAACNHDAIVAFEPNRLFPLGLYRPEWRGSVLLERITATELRARVFPIPPGGTRAVLVEYASRLGPDEPYRVPLRGMPAIGALSIEVHERSPDVAPRTLRLDRARLLPDRDFVLPPPRLGPEEGRPEATVVVNQTHALAWLHLPPPAAAGTTAPQPSLEPVTLLFDTSGSSAPSWPDALERIEGLLDVLAARARDPLVRLVAFDQEAATGPAGRASRVRAEARGFLAGREAHGATDLAGALAELARFGRASGRLLLVSDGRATLEAAAGPVTAALLAGFERVDVLAAGPSPDRRVLADLARRGRRPGAVLSLERDPDAILRALRAAPIAPVDVAVRHARLLGASRTEGLVPGEAVVLELAVAPDRTPEILLDGRCLPLRLVTTDEPLVERLVAQARVERLEAMPWPQRGVKRNEELTRLSREHRLLSSGSALLVAGAATHPEADHLPAPMAATPPTAALTSGVSPPSYCPKPRPDSTPSDVLVLSPLVFAPGSASLPPGSERTLSGLARQLQEPAAWLLIAGHTAATDGGARPQELARRRAEAVRQSLLTRHGVSPERLRTVGAGSACTGAPPRQRWIPQGGVSFTLFAVRREGPVPAVLPCLARLVPPRPRTLPPFSAPHPPRIAAAFAALATNGPVAGQAAGHELIEDRFALAGRVVLGEALDAAGRFADALRVFGSLADLIPSAPGLRAAGVRFVHVAELAGAAGDTTTARRALALAIRGFARARKLSPDHPSSHRLLALALLRDGHHAEAVATLEAALGRDFDRDRFPGAADVLKGDLAWITADWRRVDPGAQDGHGDPSDRPAGARAEPRLRFVLTWEGDEIDVDLVLHDGAGDHHGAKVIPPATPELLRADVTRGYGLEELAIPRGPLERQPWQLSVHAGSLDPRFPARSGPVLGQVERLELDDDGRLRVESRPFLITNAHGWLELGP